MTKELVSVWVSPKAREIIKIESAKSGKLMCDFVDEVFEKYESL